jgi:diaminopimelate decarboxylase
LPIVTDGSLEPAFAAQLVREARRLGTPLYAYDGSRIDRDAEEIRSAFPTPPWIRLYSAKANLVPGVIGRVAEHGFGVSTVSRGEAALALRAGVPADRIVLEGVGKTDADIRFAVDLAASGHPLLWVSLESVEDAASLAAAGRRGLPSSRSMAVLVRVNPEVEPETHHGLAVGARGSKFGVLAEEVETVLRAGGGTDGPLRWRGIHVHVGSQLGSVDAWKAGIALGLEVFAHHAEGLSSFDTLDVGGGLPADPFLEDLPRPRDFALAATSSVQGPPTGPHPSRLAIEPGRALVAAAGWLVARVLHVRQRPEKGEEVPASRTVVLDAGMTELVRPAMYGAQHPMFALSSSGRPFAPGTPLTEAIVEGPVCESTDRFGLAALPHLERGDLVAIGHAGAYGSAMASTYNGRPRAPEVMLESGGSRTLLRRRGTLASLP